MVSAIRTTCRLVSLRGFSRPNRRSFPSSQYAPALFSICGSHRLHCRRPYFVYFTISTSSLVSVRVFHYLHRRTFSFRLLHNMNHRVCCTPRINVSKSILLSQSADPFVHMGGHSLFVCFIRACIVSHCISLRLITCPRRRLITFKCETASLNSSPTVANIEQAQRMGRVLIMAKVDGYVL